tara:strand:+ start:449 stop:742 length:294 start_codon:yes stop_codon:yes gene_type:complete
LSCFFGFGLGRFFSLSFRSLFFLLALEVRDRLHEDALGQLRCSRRIGFGRSRSFLSFGHFRFSCFYSKFFAKGVGRDIVNRAGCALHLEATTFQKLN